MARASTLPAGVQLRPYSQAKMRCVNLNTNTNFWDDFWNQLWDPVAITAQLSYYSSVGFNTVKVYCDGMPSISPTTLGLQPGSGYPSDAVMVQRIQWFITQCRQYNLAVYLACNQNIEFAASNKTVSTTLAIIAKFLGWWVAYGADVVVALDLCNEFNGGKGGGAKWGNSGGTSSTSTQMLSDMQALTAMARATVPWALTASVLMPTNGSAAFTNNSYLDMQYTLGLDYHDYHPYFGFNPTRIPQAVDMQYMRSRAKYVGKAMIGECGTGPDVTPDSSGAGRYPGFQAAWVKGMGAAASAADNYGANWFCSKPYNDGSSASGSLYGILDANNANPSSIIVSNIQASWPGGAL